MTFEEKDLKKEKKVWHSKKNKNNIIFLFLLDIKQKIIQDLTSYKFLNIYPFEGEPWCSGKVVPW